MNAKIPSKSNLQAELVLQSLLLFPTLICYFFSLLNPSSGLVLIALIGQFFLGCLQMLTCLIRWIRHLSPIRKKYFTFAITYVGVLVLSAYFEIYFRGINWLVVPAVIIIPMLMACFYWAITLLQLQGKFIENAKIEIDLSNDDDIIIDSIMKKQKERAGTK